MPYPLDVRTDPVLAVASYYTRLPSANSTAPTAIGENGPVDGSTLSEFAAGYVSTIRVAAFMAAPIFEDFGAGNGFARVPVLLTAEHTDGSRHNYAGCITTHKTNVPIGDATEPDPNWYLRDAEISEVADFDLALLDIACEAPPTKRWKSIPPSSARYRCSRRTPMRSQSELRSRLQLLGNAADTHAGTVRGRICGHGQRLMVVRADALGVAAGSTYASIPGS